MNNAKPLFDPTTHYQIKLQGRVAVDWLQSFDSAAKVIVDGTSPLETITVLNVQTDQSGIIGLVRRLHGLGMTILQLQIVSNKEEAAEV